MRKTTTIDGSAGALRGTHRHLLLALAAVATALASPGCDDDIVPPIEGQRVSGRVFYDGDISGLFDRPNLQVTVAPVYPPTGAPHGITVVPDPEFSAEGVAYEVTGIPAYGSYQVAARVFEQSDPDLFIGPSGAFPDFCQTGAAEGGVVGITDDEPTTDIDITMYDQLGQSDPCFDTGQAPECPMQTGRASLVVNVNSALDPATFTETDSLLLAVFTMFPGPPAGFTTVLRADLDFPVRAILNNLAPNDYIVFACYDREGDNIMDCGDSEASMNDGDLGAFYNGQTPVTLAADSITTLGLALETAASEAPDVESAEDAGCTP